LEERSFLVDCEALILFVSLRFYCSTAICFINAVCNKVKNVVVQAVLKVVVIHYGKNVSYLNACSLFVSFNWKSMNHYSCVQWGGGRNEITQTIVSECNLFIALSITVHNLNLREKQSKWISHDVGL